MSDSPNLFRVTLEVGDLEAASQLYADLFGQDGKRHPVRHLQPVAPIPHSHGVAKGPAGGRPPAD